MEQTVQQSYDEKLDPPVVLYAPDGRTRKIDDPRLETTLAKTGWRRKPYPPAIPEEDKGDYGQQIQDLCRVMQDALDKLENRVANLEIKTMAGDKKTKGK
jgi:hypothetical protein